MKFDNLRCTHFSYMEKSAVQEKAYCRKCGIVFFINKTREYSQTVKPIAYQIQITYDPFVYIKKMEQYEDEHVLFEHTQWYKLNRSKAIMYLKKLYNDFGISEKTFFSALAYLDIIMSSLALSDLTDREFSLKAIACFVIAGKFSENDARSFDLSQFSSFDKQEAFDRAEIIQCELETLKQLDYNLCNVTIYDYISCVLNCGIVLEKEVCNEQQLDSIFSFSLNLLAKVLLYNAYPKFSNYQIVFAIIYLTRKLLNLKDNVIVIKNIFNVFSWEYLDCVDYLLKLSKMKKREKSINSLEQDYNSELILYSRTKSKRINKIKATKKLNNYSKASNEESMTELTSRRNNNNDEASYRSKTKESKALSKKCRCKVSCFAFFKRKISVSNY